MTVTSDLTLSAKAAARLHALSAKAGAPVLLRVAVDGGGCSGFQYRFELVDSPEADDWEVQYDGAKAVAYAQGLVRNPQQTVLVVISDFYEEAFVAREMVRRMAQLIADGAKVLGLMALDEHAVPTYDHEVVQAMANVGAKMGAMTPGHLAAWLAEQLQA